MKVDLDLVVPCRARPEETGKVGKASKDGAGDMSKPRPRTKKPEEEGNDGDREDEGWGEVSEDAKRHFVKFYP